MAIVGAGRGPGFLVIVWRAMVAGTGLVALIFGYAGLSEFIPAHPGPHHPLDLLYYDAQLFVLSSPPIDGGDGHLPIMLQIARFAAPAVTAYAFIEAGRRLFATELALLRTRLTRHHHVVCGDGAVAQALAARLRGQGRRVVRICTTDSSDLDHRRTPFVQGDPTTDEVLYAAGLHRARVLYVCTTDSAVNLAVALAVSNINRSGPGALEVHVQVDDPELCLALQARRLDLPSSPRLKVNFFSSHELAAQTLLAHQPPPDVTDRSPQFMIVGTSPFGTALAVELARYWRGRETAPYPLEIVFVDVDADAAIDRLHRRYPFLADVARFTAHEVRIDSMLDGDLQDAPPDRVYLCGEDEEVALKLALTMDHFWRRGPRSLVVRLSRLGLLDKAFHATDGDRLLDDVAGTLYLFDAVRAGSDPHLVEHGLVERLGRAIHENYLAMRRREGIALEAGRAMRGWTDLAEDVRDANRAQAADVGRKLRAIGCVLAPSPVWGDPQSLDRPAVERLAHMEHDRWSTYMREAGWRYGPQRDDEERLHPDLVDWVQLAEGSREKDREAVREIPTFLADAGFQIVRLLS